MKYEDIEFLLLHGIPVLPEWFEDGYVLVKNDRRPEIFLGECDRLSRQGLNPVLFINESTDLSRSGRVVLGVQNGDRGDVRPSVVSA